MFNINSVIAFYDIGSKVITFLIPSALTSLRYKDNILFTNSVNALIDGIIKIANEPGILLSNITGTPPFITTNAPTRIITDKLIILAILRILAILAYNLAQFRPYNPTPLSPLFKSFTSI
jgi:hypothetical protein